MKQHEKQEDMSLPQILEDIQGRICDEHCKWPSQYPWQRMMRHITEWEKSIETNARFKD